MNQAEQREALVALGVEPSQATTLAQEGSRHLADRLLPGASSVTDDPQRDRCVAGFALWMDPSGVRMAAPHEVQAMKAAMIRIADALGCTVAPRPEGM